MKFGNSNHQNVKMPHWIWSFGPDLAPLSRNRVKNLQLPGSCSNCTNTGPVTDSKIHWVKIEKKSVVVVIDIILEGCGRSED